MFEAMKAMGDLADVATADLRAAHELGHNPNEYTWIKERVLEAQLNQMSQAVNQQMVQGQNSIVKMLEEQKRDLSQDIDRTVHTMQDEATIFADPNDRASQESDMSLELRNRDRERKLIKKIDETIGRIDGGEYGYCDSCGVEIGLKRLEARPTATLCIDCKTLDEMRERQVAK